MLKKILHFFILVSMMVSLGLLIRHFSIKPMEGETNLSTQAFFNTNLLNVEGKPQQFSDYKGKVLVVNFWATWCPPCREEMPEFSEFQQTYAKNNVVVLGIAVDEPESVNAFLKTAPVSYPIVISNESGPDLSSILGNDQGVLPYTVIIDSHGKVTKTFFGRVNKALLETSVSPLTTNASIAP